MKIVNSKRSAVKKKSKLEGSSKITYKVMFYYIVRQYC